jgi:hypothetical protein
MFQRGLKQIPLMLKHAIKYKSGVDTKLKESIKKEINHLKQKEEVLERERKTFGENKDNEKLKGDD